jgi:hypothetical protein
MGISAQKTVSDAENAVVPETKDHGSVGLVGTQANAIINPQTESEKEQAERGGDKDGEKFLAGHGFK